MLAHVSGKPRSLERVLIVEDNAPLRAAIARWVSGRGGVALEAATAAAARAQIDPPPDLAIVDVRLPDDTAFGVLEAMSHQLPRPLVVVMSGRATPEEAFQLAQLGVGAYLAKPFSLSELEASVDEVLARAPEIDAWITASVGKVPMRELQGRVRQVMVDQALAMSEGSRSGAARLLEVSRQAVQQMVRSASHAAETREPTSAAPSSEEDVDAASSALADELAPPSTGPRAGGV